MLDGVTSLRCWIANLSQVHTCGGGIRDLLHGVYRCQDDRNTILACKAWNNFGPAAIDAVTDMGLQRVMSAHRRRPQEHKV